MTIHHALLRKAKKHGLTMTEADDGKVDVFDDEDTLIAANKNPKTALDHAIELITKSAAKTAAAAARSKPKGKAKPKAKAKGKARDKDAPASMVQVMSGYREKYRQFDDSCGDEVAELLRAHTGKTNKDGKSVLDVKALQTVAKTNGIDLKKYAHLNPGHQRMCIGNVLRGMITRGETVKIGSHTLEVSDEG